MIQHYLAVTMALICVSAQSPVKVSVYYESRCSDSVFFVLNQLKPTFDVLGPSRMAVDFVPYGKAIHTARGAGFTFRNQHGPPEYQDNKMQACVIATLAGTQPAATVSFVACALDRPDHAANTDGACFNAIGPADKSKIGRCNEGVHGDQLLASHGDRTHALSPKISLQPNMGHIPRIEINGVYNAMEERMANENLKGLICSKFHWTEPHRQQQCMLETRLATIPQISRMSFEPNYPQVSPNYPQYSSTVYPSLLTTADGAYPTYSTPNSIYNQRYQSQATSIYPGYQSQPSSSIIYPEYPSQNLNVNPTGFPMANDNQYPGYPSQTLRQYPGYPSQTLVQYPGYPSQTLRQYPGYPSQTLRQYPGYPSQTLVQYPSYPSRTLSPYPGYPSQTPSPYPGYTSQTTSPYPDYPSQTTTYPGTHTQYPAYPTQT